MRNSKGEMRETRRKGRPGYALFQRKDGRWDGYRRDHNLAKVTRHPTSETLESIYLL